MPDGAEIAPGTFVVVPLGPMKRIGAVWREGAEPKPFDPKKLKSVVSVLDVPPLPPINLAFADWPQVFGDAKMTTALLDRLTHRIHILEANGESYRLKEKRKAGLLGRTPLSAEQEAPGQA